MDKPLCGQAGEKRWDARRANPEDEAYNQYAAMTEDEAQHSRSRLSTGCRQTAVWPSARSPQERY